MSVYSALKKKNPLGKFYRFHYLQINKKNTYFSHDTFTPAKCFSLSCTDGEDEDVT